MPLMNVWRVVTSEGIYIQDTATGNVWLTNYFPIPKTDYSEPLADLEDWTDLLLFNSLLEKIQFTNPFRQLN